MAKRRPRPAPRYDRRQPPPQRPADDAAGLLRRAILALRRGDTNPAVGLAQQALGLAGRAEEQAAARAVIGEAYFRAACLIEDPAQRLEQLDRAAEAGPDAPRLRFHRAIALGQLDRLPEAAAELDAVAAHEPNRPGLAYLRTLASLGLAGRSVPPAEGLTPKEAATLDVIRRFWLDPAAVPPPAAAEQPLLGDSAELWQALADLDRQPDAAPVEALNRAARQAGGKSVRRVIGYYQGVAALRAGDRRAALAAWRAAHQAGFRTAWAAENYAALLRETAVALAEAGQWQAIADLAGQVPEEVDDQPLVETLALAFDHLGFAAAERGGWRKAAEHWERANTLAPSRRRAQNLALAEEALEDWEAAALAWRDMLRRRPRKADHPDYLDDRQVADLWLHAADCHARADDYEAEAECLRTALKYAPDDVDLRLKLADALSADDRTGASSNELERILDRDPDNLEALIRLGTQQLDELTDAIPTWQRAFVLAPDDHRVRDGLAAAHVKRLSSKWYFLARSQEKDIKAALADLPEHPQLLLYVAHVRRDQGKPDEARALYLRAYRAAPEETKNIAIVLISLLHQGAEADIEALLPELRRIPDLLPPFWIAQGKRVIEADLADAWATRYFDEAVALAEMRIAGGGRAPGDSKAAVLIEIFDEIFDADGASPLMAHYAERIRREVPESGAVEYVAAHHAYYDAEDARQAERLLRAAIRKAGQAGDAGVAEAAQRELDYMKGPPIDTGMLRRLIELFPDGPPDLDDLENLPDDVFQDLFKR